MITTPQIRASHDPRFVYVLVNSKLNPGTKAWKLVHVGVKKA